MSYALIISGEGKKQYDDILIQYYDLFVDERIEKKRVKTIDEKREWAICCKFRFDRLFK